MLSDYTEFGKSIHYQICKISKCQNRFSSTDPTVLKVIKIFFLFGQGIVSRTNVFQFTLVVVR